MNILHPEGCESIEAREGSTVNKTHIGGLDAANITLIVTLGLTLLITAASVMVAIWAVVEIKEARASIQYYERAFRACPFQGK